MSLLLCVAIFILICFLIGGIGRLGAHPSHAGSSARRDSLGLPLAVMLGMMLLCLVGLVWARSLHRQAQAPAQVMAQSTECCEAMVQTEVSSGIVVTESQPAYTVHVHPYIYEGEDVHVQITTPEVTITQEPVQTEESKDTEQTPAEKEDPCSCDK